MKKFVIYFILLAIIGLSSANSIQATPVLPYRTTAVPYASLAPRMDGVIEDVYSPVQTTNWIYPDQQPEYGGPHDFIADFYLCWDWNYLYMVAIITDDVIEHYEWGYSSPWMFDNIEIFIQLDTNTSINDYDILTGQIRICRGLDSIETHGNVDRTEYLYYMEPITGTGWITEVGIPWEFAAPDGILPDSISSYIEDAMGFDFMGSDSDNSDGDLAIGNRDYQTAWDLDGQDGMEDLAWQSVRVFGYITFKGIGYIKPITTIEIPEINMPMTIDGYDYETSWGSEQTLELFNSFDWEAEYDLSGYFKTCWDREYLYLYAHINDDHNYSWPGNDSYGSFYDNLEVYLDLDTFATDTRYRNNSTVMIRFCRGNDIVESSGRTDASEFQFTMWNFGNGTGWAMEAAIPWTVALAVDSSPEDIEEHLPVIGFDIIVNDLDEEGLIPREEHSQLVFDRDESELPGLLVEDEALTNTRTFGIAVLENALTVSTPNLSSEIELYPNPVSTRLFLSGLDEVEMIEIIDVSGQKLMQYANPRTNISMDVSKLSSGTYFVKFYLHSKHVITKAFSIL